MWATWPDGMLEDRSEFIVSILTRSVLPIPPRSASRAVHDAARAPELAIDRLRSAGPASAIVSIFEFDGPAEEQSRAGNHPSVPNRAAPQIGQVAGIKRHALAETDRGQLGGIEAFGHACER
jgi:hypothetical protein